MKAWNMAVLLAVILAIGVPYSADAFGSYSQDELNTTNTEQNLTFDVSPYAELVYITIPRRANITSAEWNFTGHAYDYLSYQENWTEYNSTGTWRVAAGINIKYGYDGIWTGDIAECEGGGPCRYYVNYTIPSNATGAFWQYNWWWASLNEMENITIPSSCQSGTKIQLYLLINDTLEAGPGSYFTNRYCMNSTDDWQLLIARTTWKQFVEEAIWWNITDYPENVTIDTGNNGEDDFVNDTVFNTSEIADLNVTAINDYLHDTCTADWVAGTCDVPFNVSSDTAGLLEISAISIIGEFIFGIFNVSILDEMTGDAFDISGSDSVILSFYCANETENFTITSQGQDVNVLCVVDEVRITVTEATDEIIRYLVPTTAIGDLDFYVYNSTEENDTAQDWVYFDVTGLYENGIVIVDKVIFDLGELTMIEKIMDAESKTTLYLVVGERYCISVFDSSRTNERNLGCMDGDTDAEKLISISNIPYEANQNLLFEDVLISFAHDVDLEIIQGTYNDTLGQTTSVVFTVYNASNISQVMFTASSVLSVVTFTYNGVDINTTYIAEITAVHATYGVIDPQGVIDFAGRFRVAGLSGLGYGIYMSIAAGLIAMFVMLAFTRRFAKIGPFAGVLTILLFMQFGWFEEVPQLTWPILTLFAFVSVLSVFVRWKRL